MRPWIEALALVALCVLPFVLWYLHPDPGVWITR